MQQDIDWNDPKQRAAAIEHEKHVLRARDEAKRAVAAERNAATEPPDILTLRERLALPRPETKWRIANLQGVGHRVLIAAQFKAGKTTLAANVARSVLDGDPFLDTFKTTAIEGALALFDFEMSPTQLDDWYRAQNIQRDDQLLVIPMRGAASSFNIIDAEARGEWVKRLRAFGVKYLILDCLRPVLDALGLNEHTEAGLFLTALDALLTEAGIPEALVIQHMGHKGERARGDSRLLDWPDVGWTLTREKVKAERGEEAVDDPSAPRYFKAFGRDVDVPEAQLTYNPKTRRLSMAVDDDGQGASRADVKDAATRQAIFDFVSKAASPPSQNEIEKGVKGVGTQVDVRRVLHAAVAKGLIVVEPGKRGARTHRIAESPVEPGLLDSVLLHAGEL
jgi:hypothetical protein